MIEIWRPCSSWEGFYEVSNQARVRRIGAKAPKKQTVAAVGYLVVGLWKHNKGRVCYVHDLVASAFNGRKPAGLSVNHKDGDKKNNSPQNLEYVTLAENARHAWTTGLCPDTRGELSKRAKLTNDQAINIFKRAKQGEKTKNLAAEFGVSSSAVSEIKTGKKWRHVTALA